VIDERRCDRDGQQNVGRDLRGVVEATECEAIELADVRFVAGLRQAIGQRRLHPQAHRGRRCGEADREREIEAESHADVGARLGQRAHARRRGGLDRRFGDHGIGGRRG
jgi:hypothetical protein